MSTENGFFTILEQVNEFTYKIKEKIPESVTESIEIVQKTPPKNQEGQPATLYKTTQGRQFARLDEWPKDLLLEIK